MAEDLVLRISRSDTNVEDYVLLYLKSNGDDCLDLDIIGTDGENPFATILNHRNISKLKSKTNEQDEVSWKACLRAIFFDEQPQESDNQDITKGLQLYASIKQGGSLILSIRQEISGITHTLGSISLSLAPQKEISLFEWTTTAVSRSDNLSKQVAALCSKNSEQEKIVEQLRGQLSDLVRAKQEHEDEILEKCRQLLNTKKLKIRDQQRLLSTAKFSERDGKGVQDARAAIGATRQIHSTSRPAKRKADEEVMDMDQRRDGSESDAESDDDAFQNVKTPESPQLTESGSDKSSTARVASVSPKEEPHSQTELPPPRTLPFGNPRPEVAATPLVGDDEETDDEL